MLSADHRANNIMAKLPCEWLIYLTFELALNLETTLIRTHMYFKKDRGFHGDGVSEGRLFPAWWHYFIIDVGDDS